MPPIHSKPIQIPEDFTLAKRKHIALTWIDRELRGGKTLNRKIIAEACNIAYSTMQHAANGRWSVEEEALAKCKPTTGEEKAVLEYCSLLSSWLQPPQDLVVEDMALGLLLLQGQETFLSAALILSFVKRHDTLTSAFSKQIEHCQALQANNPTVPNPYFD